MFYRTHIRDLKFPRVISENSKTSGQCSVCGSFADFIAEKVITEELATQWEIPQSIRDKFDKRESLKCSVCASTFRNRQLAKAILKTFSKQRETSLAKLVKSKSFRHLKVAEINSCGQLHKFLTLLPNLYYSEFAPQNSETKSENLHKLSYLDNFFDLVLTSDTLEHVPRLDLAISEIHRVLKVGGLHIFTIPAIFSRSTRARIVPDGRDKKLLPDAFHGGGEPDNLVYREFGGDIIKKLKEHGFDVKLFFYNLVRDDYSSVFVTKKL